MPDKHTCGYCGKSGISTLKGLRSHITQRRECRKASRRVALSRPPKVNDSDTDSGDENKSTSSASHDDSDIGMGDADSPEFDDNVIEAEYDPPIEEDHFIPSPVEDQPPSRKATVEDIDEDDDTEEETHRWIHDFPKPAGVALDEPRQETTFEKIRKQQQADGEEPWSPYDNIEEWELANFLNQTLGHNSIDKYLRLPIVCIHSPSQRSVLTSRLL